MKYAILFFLIFCQCELFAQTNTDSLKKLPLKQDRSKAFIKLGFATGGVNFDHKTSAVIFQSGPGLGTDIMIGFKAHKRLAVGFGGNFVTYHLNKRLLDQSVGSYFADYEYNTMDTSYMAGRMSKTSGYLYASYWRYRPKFIVELYTKLCLSSTLLQLSNVVYRHKNLSQYSEYFLLNKSNAYVGFLPSVGICGSKPISKVVFLYLSAEYGYYFNDFNTMRVSHYASNGTEDIYSLAIPRAAHIFQANIGLMIRTMNRVRGY